MAAMRTLDASIRFQRASLVESCRVNRIVPTVVGSKPTACSASW
jgi:hypothetical protein